MKKIIISSVLTTILVACGGGGGGGGDNGSNSTTSAPAPSGSLSASELVVVAKVDGLIVPGYPAVGNNLPPVALISGQELEIISDANATISSDLNGAVAALKSTTPLNYKAILAANRNTNATITVKSAAVAALGATVPVVIQVAQFQPVLPKVGEAFVYSEKDEKLDGTSIVFENTKRKVASVNSDGSWTEQFLNPLDQILSTVNLSKNGNRTSMLAVGINSQACNASGDREARFSPEEKLLDFPLFVNKSLDGAWLSTCGTIDGQAESMTAKVIGFENVTTPAGTFNSLRIDQTIVVTNSTNSAYLGQGYTQKAMLWFDPVLGRMVKFVGQRYYDSPAVSKTLVSKANIELVSYVRQPFGANNIQTLSAANALLSGVPQPASSTVTFADTGRYRCSALSSGEAYSLYLQGHTYLDRDRDGKPCEANDVNIENVSYGLGPTGTSSLANSNNQCYVSGYYRTDGTYVQGYYRSCSTPLQPSTPTSSSTPAATTSGSTSSTSGGRCYVNGYRRSNGTYVSGYYRSC